jgi:ATP synthase protein I
MPAASLLVALLTYTLQVLAMGLAFAAISRSGALDESLDRAWLAAAVIAGTAGWLVLQIVLATRVRIPVYELRSAGHGPTAAQAGER